MLHRGYAMVSTTPLLSSSCRRRKRASIVPTTAYVLPPPLAASVIAVISVSVTLALRTFLTPSEPRTNPLQGLSRRLQLSLRSLLPRPPIPLTSPPSPPDISSRLDLLRDRAVAQLDSESFGFSKGISREEYAELAPVQRRELLAAAFTNAREISSGTGPKRRERIAVVQEKKEIETQNSQTGFWKIAENINGRAAAVGFMLCLAREVAEPGHPSLFEQVVDVVVPIAQKTPPFLVAVCDRVVDLLT